MQTLYSLFTAAICISCTALTHAQSTIPMNYLPEHYQTYHLTDRLDFQGDDLYDYINGGAELYLSYGLTRMTGAKYNAENLPQITIEIYEMTSPQNAFGVYTQSRDRDEHVFGQGSQRFNDFILFWKDRFFVVVNTHRATPESAEAIRHFATLTDQAISGTTPPPDLVNALPAEGLTPGGFVYFHHYIWLNAYFFIADYNIVNITDSTDAILAKYGPPEARCYLLLVEYPAASDAAAAALRLREGFAPELRPDDPFVLLEDGTWFTLRQEGKRLVAVFNGNTRQQVEALYHSAF
jgi:hypothetical protein